MAQYFAGKTIDNPKLSAKSAWLPPTSGLRDWKTQLPEEDTAVFEGIAGDFLHQAGYERSSARVTRAAVMRIEKSREWWRHSGKH